VAETATRLRVKTGEMVESIDMVLDVWSKVLTPREREVTLLVARGLKNKEVALELGVSNGTVKIHSLNIFRKLGAKSRYDLIVQRSAA
jgi:DNA-binding NarL/FixJ family response regulator